MEILTTKSCRVHSFDRCKSSEAYTCRHNATSVSQQECLSGTFAVSCSLVHEGLTGLKMRRRIGFDKTVIGVQLQHMLMTTVGFPDATLLPQSEQLSANVYSRLYSLAC